MGDSRRGKNIMLLIIMLVVFAIIFFISLMGLQNTIVLFNIGIPLVFESWLIMLLSLGSIVRIVWELYKA